MTTRATPELAAENEQTGGGFFQKIIGIFTGGGDPDREKRRLLKEISKELKKQKKRQEKLERRQKKDGGEEPEVSPQEQPFTF